MEIPSANKTKKSARSRRDRKRNKKMQGIKYLRHWETIYSRDPTRDKLLHPTLNMPSSPLPARCSSFKKTQTAPDPRDNSNQSGNPFGIENSRSFSFGIKTHSVTHDFDLDPNRGRANADLTSPPDASDSRSPKKARQTMPTIGPYGASWRFSSPTTRHSCKKSQPRWMIDKLPLQCHLASEELRRRLHAERLRCIMSGVEEIHA